MSAGGDFRQRFQRLTLVEGGRLIHPSMVTESRLSCSNSRQNIRALKLGVGSGWATQPVSLGPSTIYIEELPAYPFAQVGVEPTSQL